jgi:hypothetical protein
MTIVLESMAVAMPEVKGHPNRVGFRGVLTVVDAASQRAPSGSGGRRVVLPKSVAEAALPSLLGMALDYAPSFDRHDVRRKVGVITSAEIVGRNLEVGGYVYARDFPEIVEEIAKEGRHSSREIKTPTPSTGSEQALSQKRDKGGAPGAMISQSEGLRLRASLAEAVERLRSLTSGLRANRDGGVPYLRAESDAAGAAGLGMSYEVTDVVLADRRAKVWTLTRVTFTGAAILRKSKAAYQDTWIELAEKKRVTTGDRVLGGTDE